MYNCCSCALDRQKPGVNVASSPRMAHLLVLGLCSIDATNAEGADLSKTGRKLKAAKREGNGNRFM